MGLPTSEMQADFHPLPKLGLAYVLYGLGESKDRDSCHLGMLLRTGVFPGPGLCVHGSQPHGQNSSVQSPGPASE